MQSASDLQWTQICIVLDVGGEGKREGRATWAEAMTCGNKHVMNPDQRWASLGHSGALKTEKIKEL